MKQTIAELNAALFEILGIPANAAKAVVMLEHGKAPVLSVTTLVAGPIGSNGGKSKQTRLFDLVPRDDKPVKVDISLAGGVPVHMIPQLSADLAVQLRAALDNLDPPLVRDPGRDSTTGRTVEQINLDARKRLALAMQRAGYAHLIQE